MNILIPEPNPYDLSFHLFSIPVRVHPAFWIVHALIGYLFAQLGGYSFAFIWIAAAFGSILVHELGHVVAGWRFGASGEIILTIFGGLAVGSSDLHSRMHRILVYLAGPLAQLLLAGIVWLAQWSLPADDNAQPFTFSPLEFTLAILIGINVAWPIFNLIPIPPLDGGQILLEIIAWRRAEDRPPWEQDPDWWKRG